jgi:hypothetical protein
MRLAFLIKYVFYFEKQQMLRFGAATIARASIGRMPKSLKMKLLPYVLVP